MLYFLRFPLIDKNILLVFLFFFYLRSKLRKNVASFSGEIDAEKRSNSNREDNFQILSTHLHRKSNETNRNATKYFRDNQNDSIQTNPCKCKDIPHVS